MTKRVLRASFVLAGAFALGGIPVQAGVGFSYSVSGSHFYCRTGNEAELNWFRSSGGWDFDGNTACRRHPYSASGGASGESWNGALPIAEGPFVSSARDSSPLSGVFNASMQAVALRESAQALRIEATYQVSSRNYGASPIATALTGTFGFSGDVEFFPAPGEVWAMAASAGSGASVSGLQSPRRVSLSEGELLFFTAGEGSHRLSAGGSVSVVTARGASSGQGYLMARAIAVNPTTCSSGGLGSLSGDWTSQNALSKICGYYRGYSDLPRITGREERTRPLNDALGFYALGRMPAAIRDAIAASMTSDLELKAEGLRRFTAMAARNPLVRAWQRRARAAMAWYVAP